MPYSQLFQALVSADARQRTESVSLFFSEESAFLFGVKFAFVLGIFLAFEFHAWGELIYEAHKKNRRALPRQFSRVRIFLRLTMWFVIAAELAFVFNLVGALSIATVIGFALRDSDDNNDRFDRLKLLLGSIIPTIIGLLNKLDEKAKGSSVPPLRLS